MVSTELHLSVFSAETISSDKMSINISDTLYKLYFVKKMSEHRFDIRILESCVDPNRLMVERQDPDTFPCLQTQERCALEIAAYVFKETKSATMNIFRFFNFLFKSFVKVELSYVFTINLITIAESCTEK